MLCHSWQGWDKTTQDSGRYSSGEGGKHNIRKPLFWGNSLETKMGRMWKWIRIGARYTAFFLGLNIWGMMYYAYSTGIRNCSSRFFFSPSSRFRYFLGNEVGYWCIKRRRRVVVCLVCFSLRNRQFGKGRKQGMVRRACVVLPMQYFYFCKQTIHFMGMTDWGILFWKCRSLG